MEPTPVKPVARRTPPAQMVLTLNIQDQDVIEELSKVPEETRQEYALGALRVGILALRQVRGELDVQRLRDESQQLLQQLAQHFKNHAESVQKQVEQALREYFDPNTGRFQERVQRLLAKDGELERFLREKIGSENSELVQVLDQFVGKESRLFRLLDPENQHDGLIAQFRNEIEQRLKEQREAVLREFSLDNAEGALSRFIQQLQKHHGQLTEDLEEKIDEVVKEFSLDQEDSALSRLVRKVEKAQQQITAEFSLDMENSALARLRRELLDQLHKAQEAQHKFQTEVQAALQSLHVRRQVEQQTTKHGLEFEQVVYEFLSRLASQHNDVAENVGDTTGAVSRCKVGDIVITLGSDSAAPEARIVWECKAEQGYTIKKALEELDKALENREAQIGVFVFRQDVAPDELDPLARYGDRILVCWNPEDPYTDVNLKAAFAVARALCVRQEQYQAEFAQELEALEEQIRVIETQLNTLDEILRWSSTINRNAENILRKTRKMREALEDHLEVLTQSTEALRSQGWEQ